MAGRRVLIAGCGYVGSRVAELLVANGDQVWGVTRSGRDLPDGVGRIVVDLVEGNLAVLPSSLDAVVYAVAAKSRERQDYERAYVTGLTRLLGVVDPQRLLFVSSTSVFGDTDGKWVDEETPAEPNGFSGKVMLRAEELAKGRGGVILRLAGIYGPQRTRLIRVVRDGKATIATTPRYTNRIHREDCARAVVHLLDAEAPDSVYIGVDDEPADISDVYAWITEQLGLELRTSDEPSAGRGTNKRCRNQRLRDSGFALRYPTFREGYGELLD